METNTTIINKDNVLNIGQIKSMLDEIDMMTIEEHHNIINILKKHDISYMENDNGIFLKLNQLSIEIIFEIYKYVEDVRNTKNNLETAIRSVEYKPTIDTESNDTQTINQESNIQLEDWKKAIIEKMRNDSKVTRNKKRKSTQKNSNNE
jgi:hypothetical protein|uniref:NET domain-containing protein n=1 Tax=viral metagenome TaxID=1070528 RepID=A0A6C0AGC6_9ZZZZ|tara:strand:+ start:11627 stop:12073 length:447 start_codon:yes stop_codon:yes gene_type:complete